MTKEGCSCWILYEREASHYPANQAFLQRRVSLSAEARPRRLTPSFVARRECWSKATAPGEAVAGAEGYEGAQGLD